MGILGDQGVQGTPVTGGKSAYFSCLALMPPSSEKTTWVSCHLCVSSGLTDGESQASLFHLLDQGHCFTGGHVACVSLVISPGPSFSGLLSGVQLSAEQRTGMLVACSLILKAWKVS